MWEDLLSYCFNHYHLNEVKWQKIIHNYPCKKYSSQIKTLKFEVVEDTCNLKNSI